MLLVVKVRCDIEIDMSTLTIYRLFLFASNETDFNDNELPSSTFRWSFQISSQRPVWPELAKILHFGNIKTSCAIFSRAFLINFEPTLAISYVIRQTFIVVNGLKNDITIWSHCDNDLKVVLSTLKSDTRVHTGVKGLNQSVTLTSPQWCDVPAKFGSFGQKFTFLKRYQTRPLLVIFVLLIRQM